MKKFTHIEAFHSVVKYARVANTDPEWPQARTVRDPVVFRGTVKLHGSNAGVACLPEGLVAQSRSRTLAVGDDNHGFAGFVARPAVTEALRTLEAELRARLDLPADRRLTLFGEWCGPGLQKGVALNALPDKQFVLFAVALGLGDEAVYLDAVPQLGERFAAEGIYSILDGPVWHETVDFTRDETITAFVERASALTEEVERRCPWGARFGVEGVGEGIVWVPTGVAFGRSDLYFKTKGEKHKNTGGKGSKVAIDPEVLEGVERFVEYAVTENRLRQGLEVLAEMGLPVSMKSMGQYLRWLSEDVKRECAAELEASGLDWKQVGRAVTTTARLLFTEEAQRL